MVKPDTATLKGVGAPGNGLAITPAMLRAGWEELFCFEHGVSDADECIAALYSAMERARLEGAGR